MEETINNEMITLQQLGAVVCTTSYVRTSKHSLRQTTAGTEERLHYFVKPLTNEIKNIE